MTPKEQAAALRTLARHYHELGFNVLPLGADKRPVATGVGRSGKIFHFQWEDWQTTRQDTKMFAAILAPAWWGDVHGIGGICGAVSGGLVCADFDLPTGAHGDFPQDLVDRFLSLAGVGANYGWTVRTPRGGWHVWLLCPDLAIDKGKLDRPAVGLPDGHHIELRYTGHYAALPGSTNVDGAYTWHAGSEPANTLTTVGAAQLIAAYQAVTVDKDTSTDPKPTSARQRASSAMTPRAQKAMAEECNAVRTAREGSRNETLNRSSFSLGQLVGAGDVDRATVEAALIDAATACGLPESEVKRTIAGAIDKGARTPREPARVQSGDVGRGRDNTADVAQMMPDATEDAKLLSERIEADLLKWGYRFSMSSMDDQIYCNGVPKTDELEAQIRMTARDSGGYAGKGKISLEALKDTYTMLAAKNSFHPVKDYLNALQWDGQDHFRRLNAHFKDTHEPIIYPNGAKVTVFASWLWRWMAGVCAKVFADGPIRAQTPVLVLSGGQGLGKSTFAAWLASPLPDLYVEGPVNPDDKDHERLLASKWLWEVSELGATTRRKDREALKAFFTKADCTFRKPYGHNAIRKPALASFIGTLNPESGFLVDPTGNRRFLTVELASINHAYAQTVDVNQVWAQVMDAYRKAPHVWKLTPEEIATRDGVNAENEVERPYAGAIASYFDIDRDPLTSLWMPTVDIIAHLQRNGNRFDETIHHGTLGATLRGMGVERLQRRMNGERVWGWRGLKPKLDDPAPDGLGV